MKVLACSVMMRLNQSWFWLYSSFDCILLFLYKIARNDLRYWFNVEGLLSWVITVVFRIVVKFVVDL